MDARHSHWSVARQEFKALNDNKVAQRQLEELQRHNCVMEGRGIYLAPYKRRQGIARKKKKNVDETTEGIITDMLRWQLAKRMGIPYFRGIFMRTTLPVKEIHQNESGIVNLYNVEGPGIHWVCEKRELRHVLWQFRQSSTAETTLMVSGKQCNRVQSPHHSYSQNNCG